MNKFIVFEGIEACGKSTQAKKLAEYIEKSLNEKVWITQEPSDSIIGHTLREFLKDGTANNKILALLFAADRAKHQEEILKHLKAGEWVICDRYIGSSIAYQKHHSEKRLIDKINKNIIRPSLTFFIKVSPETALKRISLRQCQKECFDDLEILKEVNKRYNKYVLYKKTYSYLTAIINGEEEVNQVFESIKNLFLSIKHTNILK